ncbi:MAG: hypothetical protein F6K26_29460 [Moorea sp. SIO2I5]|nr:hypothetical protein [Moorena sp. SIO2I5]
MKINEKITLKNTSISQVKTDPNFDENHDAVPTVGAVKGSIPFWKIQEEGGV